VVQLAEGFISCFSHSSFRKELPMQKQNLTQASRELFRRAADERFASLDDLWRHCQDFKERSTDRWHSPAEILTAPMRNRLDLKLGGDGESYRLNDWSFSQLCKLAGVSKDTVNKVSADTAGRVLAETLPQGGKPMQVLTLDRAVRSIHGASYTRLHNLDLLAIVKEFATDFQPPQTGMNGATGLYCGEQDMFVWATTWSSQKMRRSAQEPPYPLSTRAAGS
jgi:hypothetical protein